MVMRELYLDNIELIDAPAKVNPIDLSKCILKYFKNRGEKISHKKLQKLVYYIDAWHYVFLDMPIIDEEFQAWMHGPVCISIWDYYKDQFMLNTIINDFKTDYSLRISKEQEEVILDVLDEYGDKTAYYLECLTHSELPWQEARKGYCPSDRCEETISKDIMKKYYESKLEN